MRHLRAILLAVFGALLLATALPSIAFDIESMPTPAMPTGICSVRFSAFCGGGFDWAACGTGFFSGSGAAAGASFLAFSLSGLTVVSC